MRREASGVKNKIKIFIHIHTSQECCLRFFIFPIRVCSNRNHVCLGEQRRATAVKDIVLGRSMHKTRARTTKNYYEYEKTIRTTYYDIHIYVHITMCMQLVLCMRLYTFKENARCLYIVIHTVFFFFFLIHFRDSFQTAKTIVVAL